MNKALMMVVLFGMAWTPLCAESFADIARKHMMCGAPMDHKGAGWGVFMAGVTDYVKQAISNADEADMKILALYLKKCTPTLRVDEAKLRAKMLFEKEERRLGGPVPVDRTKRSEAFNAELRSLQDEYRCSLRMNGYRQQLLGKVERGIREVPGTKGLDKGAFSRFLLEAGMTECETKELMGVWEAVRCDKESARSGQ